MLQGILTPWNGFLFLLRHPTLWRYGILPMVINLIITSIIALLFLGGVIALLTWLDQFFSRTWLGISLEVFTGIAFLLVAIVIALATWKLFEGILCGWFYSRLARNIELKLGLRPEEMVEVPWSKQIADTFTEVFTLIGINLGFLLLHFIPGIGSIIGMIGTFYFDSWILGKDFLSYPLDLRGRRRAEKIAFCKQHRGQTHGLGGVVLLFNFVPLVGPILLTTAVAGSVLLHRDLEKVPVTA